MIETNVMLFNEFASFIYLTIFEDYACCHDIEQFVLMLIDLLERLILPETQMALK